MELYRRAQDGFEAALASVGPQEWDTPSACAEWSVRDVAGHVIWGQRQLRAWATGEEFTDRSGAPGSAHPGALAASDPLATWRAARFEVPAEALARTVTLPGLGEIPVSAVLPLLLTDLVTHAWDIRAETRLDDDLVRAASDWARANVVRRPGFFGPELTPPDGADEQTRLLAFLGRAAWSRVPA